MKRRDLAGVRFGKLVAIKDVGRSNDKHRLWLCQCDCGNQTIVQSNNLLSGCIKGCGCALYDFLRSKEKRAHVSKTMKGRKKSEEQRAKISKTLSGRPLTGMAREKIIRRNKENCGPKSPRWLGGRSFEPYCSKFNEQIKEDVRDKFGRKCFLCGSSESKKKLDVHHVDYNKGQGCGQKWSLIPLCHKCHTKTTNSRHYYFNLLNNYWLLDLCGDINCQMTF